MTKLETCYYNLMDEIDVKASSNETFKEEFFKNFSDVLVKNGDLPSINYSPYVSKNISNDNKQKNIRVDGYSYEIDNDLSNNTITLIVSNFKQETDIQTFTTDQLQKEFRLAERFFEVCSEGMQFVNGLEESSTGFDVAYTLSSNLSKIKQINIYLITNVKFTGRANEIKSKLLNNKKITYKLMDIDRYCQIINSQIGEPTDQC